MLLAEYLIFTSYPTNVGHNASFDLYFPAQADASSWKHTRRE